MLQWLHMCDRRDGSLPPEDISPLHRLWSTTRWKTASQAGTRWSGASRLNNRLLLQSLWNPRLNKWYFSNTRTPAATDAMAFLLSPQSMLHSQSPHRIPSRNPDMTVEKVKLQALFYLFLKKNDTVRRRTKSRVVMLASQLFGLYMPTCQKLTIISTDSNSSRRFSIGADGLPDYQVTKHVFTNNWCVVAFFCSSLWY